MKEILKYTIWAGICATLVIPFIVANSMFFPYIVGKAFTFRIIVEILLGLWLILIMWEAKYRPKWSWILGSVLGFTFILLLADIMAVAPYKAFWSNYERMEGWVTFAHLFAYFMILSSMLNTEKLWLWFLRANLCSAFILGMVSIRGGVKAGITRFAGPLGNPIYIAVYFLFIFFFTLILLYKDVIKKNLKDWQSFSHVFYSILFYLYLMSAALSLFIVYRASRGALLGVGGGLFISVILIAIFEKKNKVIRQIAIGGVIMVIVVASTFMAVRDTEYVKNNETLSRFAEISWSNVNGQARQLVWPMALKGFKEKPILGWGQEGFNYVFNKYYDPRMYGQEAWFDRAHNAPLDFLVAGGILGLLSYLSLFGAALYLLWLRRIDPETGIISDSLSITEKSLLTGIFAGYLFQALFVFDNLVGYILFFTTLAYVHVRVTSLKLEQKKINKNTAYIVDFLKNEEYQNYIFIPLIVIVVVSGIWFINVKNIQANKSLIQTLRFAQAKRYPETLTGFKTALAYGSLGDSEIREQLLSYVPSIIKLPEVNQEIKKEFISLTVNELDKQIEKVPNDARYYILFGGFLNSVGNYEPALNYINKAIELSPNKQLMRFDLIRSLYSLGRSKEAMLEAKKAYELDVNFEQAKAVYIETVKNEINVNSAFKEEGLEILKNLGVN